MLAARKMLTDFVNKGSRHTQVSHYGILFPAICISLHLIFMFPLFFLEDLGPHCSWGKSWSWMSLHLPSGGRFGSFFHWRNFLETCPVRISGVCKIFTSVPYLRRTAIALRTFRLTGREMTKGLGGEGGKGLNYMIRETFMLTDLMI